MANDEMVRLQSLPDDFNGCSTAVGGNFGGVGKGGEGGRRRDRDIVRLVSGTIHVAAAASTAFGSCNIMLLLLLILLLASLLSEIQFVC